MPYSTINGENAATKLTALTAAGPEPRWAAVGIISSDIDKSVVAGLGHYASFLVIKPTAGIFPTATGATALTLPVATDALNLGQIIGGAGAAGNSLSAGAAGGVAVYLDGGRLANAGTLAGGTGGQGTAGGSGGAGLMSYHGEGRNSGLIEGGVGARGTDAKQVAGVGGDGIVMASSSFTNTGTIEGGLGGAGLDGQGGIGASVRHGDLVNDGTIVGGAGIGAGGVGVLLNGGTLIDQGGLIAGADGADAVRLGAVAATVALYAGARFVGEVSANTQANDALLLAGTTIGTLDGLGSEFVGFSTLSVAAGAHWTVAGADSFAGTVNLGGGSTLTASGVLTLTGPVSSAGTMEALAGATVAMNSPAGTTLDLSGVIRGAGMLALYGGQFRLDDASNTLQVASLNVTPNGVLAAAGDIAAAVTNDGTITTEANATLIFAGVATGTGVLDVLNGSSLDLPAGVGAGQTIAFDAADGVLGLANLGGFQGTIVAFAPGDKIDLVNTTATSEVYSQGTLTLYDGAMSVGCMRIDGNYSTASFTLGADGHGGTDITTK